MTGGPTDGNPGGSRWQMRFDFAAKPPAAASVSHGAFPKTLYTQEPPAPLPGEYRESPSRKQRVVHPRLRRPPSVLPVPKPLTDAIAAGHFGHDEGGKPVRPLPDEVRAITEARAEQLVNYLCRIDDPTLGGKQQAADAFNTGIAKYAEDFGEAAGERLRAYCHRLADSPDRTTTAWRR